MVILAANTGKEIINNKEVNNIGIVYNGKNKEE
jgi:hypothetical protein